MCRFAITSASGASINLGLPILLHEVLGISLNMSIASGFAISVLVNFILLRSYVFKGRNSIVSDGRFILAYKRELTHCRIWLVHRFNEVVWSSLYSFHLNGINGINIVQIFCLPTYFCGIAGMTDEWHLIDIPVACDVL